MLSRLRRRRPAPARLSVIVPVYNVEDYLAETLDSLLAQTFTDLEILLVDDGSTDGSAAIAQRYVDAHDHIRMVAQPNAGLSAARNTGVPLVSGEYLAFADSDDVVPPYAYQLMVETLDDSGSDFAVGSVLRGVPGDAVEPPWLRSIHRDRRLGVRADDFPEAVHDIFAWNKVFRRSFWDRAGMTFPEGVRYEDQVAITRAYLLADRFDVLVRPVYLWRVRTDGSSITQRRHEVADLVDRIATKQMTTATVEELASPAVREVWLRRGLPGDLPLYFAEIPTCDDTYWATLHEGMRAMVDPASITDWLLPVPHRLTGWLVAAGRRADATAVVEYLARTERGLDLDVRGDHVVARLPGLDDPTIPTELFRLAEHEIVFDGRLLAARVEGEELVVDGWAVVRGAPPGDLPTQAVAVWRRTDGVQVSADVAEWASAEATAWLDREHQNFDRSGFTARLDVGRLVKEHPVTEPQEWRLELRRTVMEISRSGGLRSRQESRAGEAAELPSWAGGHYRAECVFSPGQGGLRLLLTP